MDIKFLGDISSSIVKLYERDGKFIKLLEKKAFKFKNNFSKDIGLTKDLELELICYFRDLTDKYMLDNKNTKLYVTGIFMDILDPQPFVQYFFEQTGLYFNIISFELESFYLKKAWLKFCRSSDENMLAINIREKTTEIYLYVQGQVVNEPKKLMIGFENMGECFADRIQDLCKCRYDEIIEFLIEKIGKLIDKPDDKFDTAIYIGCELDCVGWETEIFRKTIEVFSTSDIRKPQSLLPQSPYCEGSVDAPPVLVDAICRYYDAKCMMSSDFCFMDGVICQEAEKVVICGSFNKHLPYIAELIKLLQRKGIQVLSPLSTEVVDIEGDFVLFKDDIIENHNTWAVEELHLKAIDRSDFVIACNYENYVGVSTTFELEHAHRKSKKIVFIQDNEIAYDFGHRIGITKMPCEIGIL